MSYKTKVLNLEVERCASASQPDYEVGDVMAIRVGAKRCETGRGASYQREITYSLEDGVAEVSSIEPLYPKSNRSSGQFSVHHVPPLLAETDAVVFSSVPEVRAVRSLSQTLSDRRGPGFEAGETETETEA